MQRGLREFTNKIDIEFIKKINFFTFVAITEILFFCDDLLHIYEWMKDKNPSLRLLTTTNGGVCDESWWENLPNTVR